MAFEIGKSVQFPLANTYRGPTALVQFSFSFIFAPGFDAIDQLDFAVRTALFGANIIPLLKANYLGYVLESDTAPFIDAYRVTVSLAGETDGAQGTINGPFRHDRAPGALIVASSLFAIIIALGLVLLIFGPIAYRIFNGGLSGAAGVEGLPLGIIVASGAAVAVGLLLAFGGGKSRAT